MSSAAGPKQPTVGPKVEVSGVADRSAQARLERRIGRPLAQQLVTALARPQDRRGPTES